MAITGIVSVFIFIAVIPVLLWYNLPVFVLLGVIFWLFIIETKSQMSKALIGISMVFITVYFLLLIFERAPSTYYPLKKDIAYDYWGKQESSEKNESYHDTYYRFKEAASKLNSEKIANPRYLFTYSDSMLNLNYFTDKHFDRITYIETKDNVSNETVFQKYISENDITHFVLNKLGDNYEDLECMAESYSDSKNLFEANGEKFFENEVLILYRSF